MLLFIRIMNYSRYQLLLLLPRNIINVSLLLMTTHFLTNEPKFPIDRVQDKNVAKSMIV